MNAVATNALVEAGIRHVSASSINRFIRCPESYRQRYLLDKPDRAGSKALIGSAVDKAAGEYYTARIGGGPGIDLATAQDSCRDNLLVEAERGDFDLDDESTDSLIDKAVPLIAAYLPVAQKMPDPVAVQKRVEIERDNLPVPIIGYLDVLFEQSIVDIKTAANKTQHPDWRIALRIYSAAESKPAGTHVITKTKVPAVYTPADDDCYAEPWSKARAAHTIRMAGQMMGSIESMLLMFGPDEPWPTTGLSHTWSCGSCAYKRDCVAWA